MVVKFYLVFCYNKKWWNLLGKAIQYLDGGDSSHCEIMLVDFENDLTFFGSVFPFSRLATESEFKSKYKITHSVLLEVNDYRQAVAFLNQQMAKPYSMVQIFTAALKIFTKVVLKKMISVNVNGSKHLICTELCADFLEYACNMDVWGNNDTVTISDLKKKVGIE